MRSGSRRSRSATKSSNRGIPVAQDRGIQRVHLAPVRTPAEREHDLLDGLEVLGRVLAPVAVDGDVARGAAVRGRQPDVVGGGEAHLDGERDPPPALVDERAERLERGPHVLGGQRVLHLAEAHRPLASRRHGCEASVNSRSPHSFAESRLIDGIVAGTIFATLHAIWCSPLPTRVSSTHLPTGGSGCRGALSGRRVLLLVIARSVCGNQ